MADYKNQKNRLNLFIKHLDVPISGFERSCNLGNGYVNSIKNGIGHKALGQISKQYPDLNTTWLLTGEGEMLLSEEKQSVKFYDPETAPHGKRKLIPLYDEAITIGGMGQVANLDSNGDVSEWIDPGDWFKSATAAIRHYEDSMIEYPSGCILALKEVKDKNLLVWGKDYVLETSEFRITKCVQRGEDKDNITAYSTNTETHSDGRLRHEPQPIAHKDLIRVFEVLGYVVKRGGGTIVYSNRNK